MIVSIVSLKGGVGKTTTVLHLATCAAREGEVTVLDADEERSASRWATTAELPFDVVPAERDRLAQQARAFSTHSEVVLIDTPPNNREILTRSSMVADIVVVPVKPTGLDLDRLGPTLDLLRDVDASKGELDVAILLTHYDRRRVLAQEAKEALRAFPVLQARVRHLERYAQAFGTTPSYLIEYSAVWREINEQ